MPIEHDEQNLLHCLRSRDHGQFAEFVRRYESQVFLCCKTMGLKEDQAEDVAAETFLAVWQGLAAFDGRSKLSTWLWTIAYRKAINLLRRQQPTVPFDEDFSDIAAPEPKPESEHTEAVWNAVSRLPKAWSLIVILFYKQDKTLAEIAVIMGIPENTAKTYLHRARGRLKEYLAHLVEENQNVCK